MRQAQTGGDLSPSDGRPRKLQMRPVIFSSVCIQFWRLNCGSRMDVENFVLLLCLWL